MDGGKRERPEIGFATNDNVKKSKQEFNSLSTGVGSKYKPCPKFFSTSGCPFGESCRFLHYVPGGYNAGASLRSGSGLVKTRICNKYNTTEGCKFGSKCNFAHGQWELGTTVAHSHDDPRYVRVIPDSKLGRLELGVTGAAASFGSSSAAKISIAASLVGVLIGRGGENSKLISRQTGARISVGEYESDPKLKQIDLKGSYEQIKGAETMVRELISSAMKSRLVKAFGRPGIYYKTRLCDDFTKGSCKFGKRCKFAHGVAELRSFD